jgi:hypothetical protein
MSTALFGKDAITGAQDPVVITNNALHTNQYVWDTATLSWIKQVQNSSTGTSADVNITNTSIPVSQNGAWTVTTLPTLYSKRYDQVSDVLAYLGDASVGSATSGSVWRIQKLVFTTGGSVTITFADGNTNFDNVWDNRASLSYS